ncbi:FIMAH domain-containing protein [Ruania rhizosphaerae]|uniref:FIMAH domain-containing protein n=1 Tax=Ruania rhizosphaerae TaxID=1840413 RepID=UPI001358FA8D|nr:hypothetical protein [Ruania rhizosphaerae]
MNRTLGTFQVGRRSFLQLSSVALAGVIAVQEVSSTSEPVPARERSSSAAPTYDSGDAYDSGLMYADSTDAGASELLEQLGELLDTFHADGTVQRRDHARLRAQLARADRAIKRGNYHQAEGALERFTTFSAAIDDENAREQLRELAAQVVESFK